MRSAASIPLDLRVVRIAKGDTRSEWFKQISPLGKVPVIQEFDEVLASDATPPENSGGPSGASETNSFVLSESHSILRYLSLHPDYGVSDHWYAGYGLHGKATVDSQLDWHHNYLRPGAAPLAFGRVMGPLGGLPPVSDRAMDAAGKKLRTALAQMEGRLQAVAAESEALGQARFPCRDGTSVQGPWLGGTAAPTIADLSSASEIAQLRALSDYDLWMKNAPRVVDWLSRFEAHAGEEWQSANALLQRVCDAARAKGVG